MPALLDDPTLEFMRQFDDLSKWIVKCRVPLFKPHDRMKLDPNTGKQFVAYSVTRNDMPQIAANMRRNQQKGVPARIDCPTTTCRHAVGSPSGPTPISARWTCIGR